MANGYCSKCQANRPGKSSRYCNPCHAENMRISRPKYSDLSAEQKRKGAARSHLHIAVKRGQIAKLPCNICGDEKSQAHHRDYDDHLDVRWLCRECHLLVHRMLSVAVPSLACG